MREHGATRVSFDGIDVQFPPVAAPSEEYEVHDTEDVPMQTTELRAEELAKRPRSNDPTLNDWFRKERPFQPVGIAE